MNKHHITASCYNKTGNLLSKKQNSYLKTHPIQKYFANKVKQPQKIYLHAEINAILACKGRKIHTIYVERYNQKGEPLLAKPCLICQEAIKAFGILHTIYTK